MSLNVSVQGSVGALDVGGKMDAAAAKGGALPMAGVPARFAEGVVLGGSATAGYRVVVLADDGTQVESAIFDCVFPVPSGATLSEGDHVALMWKSAKKTPKVLVGGNGSGGVVTAFSGFMGYFSG